MSSHNSIPVPMGPESSGSSGPRRRRRKQWRPKSRPSVVRRRALRAERRLEATIREIEADPKLRQKFIDAVEVDLRVDGQIARDHARVRGPADGPTEAKPDVSRRVRRTAAMPHAEVAADLVDRCRTPGERRAAAILGAELWRKQVTKVVLSIADKVEGIVNMAGAELAELGQSLQRLTTRVELLGLSNGALAAKVKSLARRGPRKSTRRQRDDLASTSKRHTARGGKS